MISWRLCQSCEQILVNAKLQWDAFTETDFEDTLYEKERWSVFLQADFQEKTDLCDILDKPCAIFDKLIRIINEI